MKVADVPLRYNAVDIVEAVRGALPELEHVVGIEDADHLVKLRGWR